MSANPLSKKRVVVTRASEQNSELGALLAAQGADVLELPLIRVEKSVRNEDLAEIFPEFGAYDWIVFTSANGVRYFFEEFQRVFDDIRSLGLIRIACIGEATARAVKAKHLRIECQPKVATAEALADELIATGSLDSAQVLLITGNLNREILMKKLEEARAIVDQLQVYKTEKADISSDPVAADFRAHGADAVLFASSSAAQSFADQAAALKLSKEAKRPKAGSIGPQTTETMKQAGIPVDFIAKEPSLEALVAATIKALSK